MLEEIKLNYPSTLKTYFKKGYWILTLSVIFVITQLISRIEFSKCFMFYILFVFRRNHQRAIESMQASLEAEAKGKAEALRIKKKLEGDINELEIALDATNRGKAELEKNVKKYQGQIRVSISLKFNHLSGEDLYQ